MYGKLRIILFIFLAFYSCLKENKIIIKHDFEMPKDGWNSDAIIEGQARSGKLFSRSDSLHPYGSGFSRNISEISENKIKRIDLITWIKKSDLDAKGDLVISLDKNQTPVFWKAFPTEGSAPHLNEWTRMYVSYDLPDSIGINEKLKVYIWNKGKLPIDLDDMEIRLYY